MVYSELEKELASKRLSAAMASRKLLILQFVRSYIGQWGASPSYGEIAAACQTNRTRVQEAVKRLVGEGLLLRRPGPRGLALPSERDAAVRLLQELGWAVLEADGTVTNPSLLQGPVLDYCSEHGRETFGTKTVN